MLSHRLNQMREEMERAVRWGIDKQFTFIY